MFKGNKLGLFLFSAPLLIVWLLLYLVIMHTDLFSWVNIEQLKEVTPDIFIFKVELSSLYEKSILSGFILYLSAFIIPIYACLFFIISFLHKNKCNNGNVNRKFYSWIKNSSNSTRFNMYKSFFVTLILYILIPLMYGLGIWTFSSKNELFIYSWAYTIVQYIVGFFIFFILFDIFLGRNIKDIPNI